MKKVFITIACTMIFGCTLRVGSPGMQTSTTRSIPSDMKVLTCLNKSMGGAIVVQVDIPQQTVNFDSSLILAIRQSAARYGQQKCQNRYATIVVIINRPEGRLVAATHDGTYWEEIRGAQQMINDHVFAPPGQTIQSSEITRVIDGFTFGMSLEDVFRIIVNAMQEGHITSDTLMQQRFISVLQQRNLFRAAKNDRLLTESTRFVDGLTMHIFSLAPLKTNDAEKLILRFYQDRLYEIAVHFRINPETLHTLFIQKYGPPQRIEGSNNHPSALIWQDAFTVLTLYMNARKQDGVVYYDKTIFGQQTRPHNQLLPKNY